MAITYIAALSCVTGSVVGRLCIAWPSGPLARNKSHLLFIGNTLGLVIIVNLQRTIITNTSGLPILVDWSSYHRPSQL